MLHNIVVWLLVAAVLLLAVWLIPRDLLRVLAAMRRVLVLLLAAAYLLFANDQGRELGISLMAEKSGWRISFLFVALIYWAANNWHTARLGLSAAVRRSVIPKPVGNEIWLFWPPRLLGVCAHLFAAVNLSFAAQNQPEFADHGLWALAAWTAPLVIFLATMLAWSLDHFLVSERVSPERKTRTSFVTLMGRTFIVT